MKDINTAGSCDSAKHYMLDASTRLKGVEQMIDKEQYFVIHAARQSGKTTCRRDLAQRLNAEERYYTLYCSLEEIQNIDDPREGTQGIVMKIKNRIRHSVIPQKMELAKDANCNDFIDGLTMKLTLFCMLPDKPPVILFDEADCLSKDTLTSFLRQLHRRRLFCVNRGAPSGMKTATATVESTEVVGVCLNRNSVPVLETIYRHQTAWTKLLSQRQRTEKYKAKQ
jgi:hypothetical protein